MLSNETAALIIGPHFDAVRDHFAAFEPEPGMRLRLIDKTRMRIDRRVRDSERHYAACSDDGREILVAPEAAELTMEDLVAILTHECGHAADFLHPAMWLWHRDKPATWVGSQDNKQGRKLARLWQDRSADQVEWTADAIAWLIVGRPIRYCGAGLVQCFSPSGILRPAGLR